MIYPRQVRKKILEILNDATSGLNAKIEEINLAESETCPTARLIHSGVAEQQYPEVFVDIGQTTPFENNPMDETARTAVISTEYPMQIWCYLEAGSTKDRLEDYKEIYFEAITELLNNLLILDDCIIKVVSASRDTTNKRSSGDVEFIVIDLKVLKSIRY